MKKLFVITLLVAGLVGCPVAIVNPTMPGTEGPTEEPTAPASGVVVNPESKNDFPPVIFLEKPVIEIYAGDWSIDSGKDPVEFYFPDHGKITAYDLEDGDVSSSIRVSYDNYDPYSIGETYIHYTAKDSAGNIAFNFQKVIVVEGGPDVPEIADIYGQPRDRTVVQGETMEMSVRTNSRSYEVSYQWQKDGEDIPGATTGTLSFQASLSDAGIYTCAVSNYAGTDISRKAELLVLEEQPAPFVLEVLQWNQGESIKLMINSHTEYTWQVRWDGYMTTISDGNIEFFPPVPGEGTYTFVITNAGGTTEIAVDWPMTENRIVVDNDTVE